MYPSLLSAVVIITLAGSGLCDTPSTNTLNIETIHHFSTNISLENLVVRRTGEIIVGFDNFPTIYQIEPEINGTATYIHTFEGYVDIHGMVEVTPDQFMVTTGNLSLVTHIDVPGSCSVWHVNMTGFPEHLEVKKVADFADSRILNGMALLDEEKGLVYVADSRVGVVNILNVNTGEHFVAINNSLTNQPPGDCQRYLYFSNFAQGIIGRVPIDENGLPEGDAEVVVSGLNTPEDFVLDKAGNIFLALFESNEVIRIDGETKEITVLAGSPDSSTYKWASAVEFGRRRSDKSDLYFAINGGFLEPDNVGGALFRIPLGDLTVV
ncbi:hypothetical protein BDP27DRAFT_1424546 [Rhodocollybia butyracea]|uniref:SMP-30/Gluconolactonase/LRE-like region domain-containing protein n=1 Tax=Rhodocollybia butyracea TaxID=206335 RepID=A0A9P5PPK8_9AGAR|nr:hypothetical protein BDP27DRAFT_1424546 [Rhodocollybia butyracea]